MTLRALFLLLALLLLTARPAAAGQITVAVAANFLTTAENLAAAFEAETGHEVALVHGSTGKLYAQIVAGAPFDVFLAADKERPARLALEGRIEGVPRPYAFGRLALVSRGPVPMSLDEFLTRIELRIAIADPAVAPYGAAAREVLEQVRGEDWDENVVFGESVAQAFAFVATGNAQAGLVALSQTMNTDLDVTVIAVPENRHPSLRQDVVQLARAADNAAAAEFVAFLDSVLAREIMTESGYGVRE